MYPIVRIALKQLSRDYGEAKLNTFDGWPELPPRNFELPFDDVELKRLLDCIDQAIREGRAPQVKLVGQKLYEETLFPPGSFRDALNRVLEKGSLAKSEVYLQLVFDARPSSALLRSYPWELMRDWLGYLHAGHRVTLVRYLSFDSPLGALSVPGALRVLLLAPRPLVTAGVSDSLGLEEPKAIVEALNRSVDASRLAVDKLFSPTFQAFSDYLTTHQGERAPHVLHFDGHGDYGRRCPIAGCRTFNWPHRLRCHKCEQSLADVDPMGHLEFYTSDGAGDAVAADAFAGLLVRSDIRLVVLSACSSAVAGRHSALSGVAQHLIAAGIPAVVAMQFSIPIGVALDFVRQFYLSLAQFDPLGEAVARGRAAIFDSGVWFPPVLFLRSKGDTDQMFVDEALTGRLPRPHKALRGRDAQMLTLTHRLLDPEIGGVLIHSMGGSGKTVFAAGTALRVAWRFHDGVIWMEARQKGVDGLLIQIADQIDDLTLTPGASGEIHERQVLKALGRGQYLLVVDGLEAALGGDDAQKVARFLEGVARKSKLLVTSRQSIALDRVDEYPLPEVSHDAAETLFWDHAGYRRRSESHARSHARRVAVELLGQHPLAIEIAARLTWRSDMTLVRLEQALESKRLNLRDVFACLDLSYQVLEEAEQTALNQLAVLRHSWTEATGRALTALADAKWEQVKDSLQDMDLLRWSEPGYYLHPVVREFAYSRLADKMSVHQRAANCLVRHSLPELRAEAHYHAIQAQNFYQARGILLDKKTYNGLRAMGQYRQLQDMVTDTLNKLPDPHLRYFQAELLRVLGDIKKAYKVLQWLQTRHQLSPDLKVLVLNEQARILKERDRPGDRELAIKVHSECLKICELLERDPRRDDSERRWIRGTRANVLHDLGMLFHYHGASPSDFRFAEELYTASAKTWAKYPDGEVNEALSLKQLAELKAWRGYPGRNVDRARAWLEQARDLFDKKGEDRYCADTIFQITKLDQDSGQFKSALDGLRRCEDIYHQLGLDPEAAIMVKQQGEVYQEHSYGKRNIDSAIKLYDKALENLPNYTDKWSRRCTVQAYYRRGEVYLELNKWDEARRDFRQAMERALDVGMESKGDRKRIVRTFCALAQVWQRLDSPAFPTSLIEQARPAFARLGYALDSATWERVDCRALLGEDVAWLHHQWP